MVFCQMLKHLNKISQRGSLLICLLAIFIISVPSISNGTPPCNSPEDKETYECRRTRAMKFDQYGLYNTTPDVIPLDYFPRDKYGFIDWTKALDDGLISPRDSIKDQGPSEGESDIAQFSKDILIKSKLRFMPDVIFPHSVHNDWLSCKICHPKIFKKKAGATPISMAAIWRGKYCGRCHDKVAFPFRNCFRCHSAPRRYPLHLLGKDKPLNYQP